MGKRAADHVRRHIIYLPQTKALRIKRAEYGVTIKAMAEDLGRNRDHLNRVLLGKSTSKMLAAEIADYFGVPVEDLFTPVDCENPPDSAVSAA